MDHIIRTNSKLVALLTSASLCFADSISLPVLTSPSLSASGPIAGNFQSFSIEFAFWPDFAGILYTPIYLDCSNVIRKRFFAESTHKCPSK